MIENGAFTYPQISEAANCSCDAVKAISRNLRDFVSQNRYSRALRPIWEVRLGARVAVAYTNDGYLRDAYRCLQ